MQKVVLGNLVSPDDSPSVERLAGSIDRFQRICPRPMGGVVVVRKVTRVLKLDKGFGDILQVGDGWSGQPGNFPWITFWDAFFMRP